MGETYQWFLCYSTDQTQPKRKGTQSESYGFARADPEQTPKANPATDRSSPLRNRTVIQSQGGVENFHIIFKRLQK
jgi:hypothetical protein